MLKLNNVKKTYISKGKNRVEALKGINLEIGDSGLVFILGKSGSGKSTLLNILGGIDSATDGEVFVDNQSFVDFKQTDYDNYRNSYIGFVFQEFNLLNDFNVSGNIALALRLSEERDISGKVENALQSVGLSSEYLSRRIDELSGGEKQRVAIARAIIKESKLILADEPTGNLDSATGESIWNILKELSQKKLVIVVTHDRESAEKYGDRIIEIADGQIVSDRGEQPESNAEAQTCSPKRKSLSNAVCFKMGTNNLLQRKIKSISVVLLAVFTIFSILLTQILLCFSSEKSIAKFIKDNNIEHIALTQGTFLHGNRLEADEYMFDDTANYIEKNTTYIKNRFVESKQHVLDMGLSFVGEALELDDDSYYLTTTGLEGLYSNGGASIEIDGKIVDLNKKQHPAEFVVGKKVGFGDVLYTVAGVIDLSKCDPMSSYLFHSSFAKESFAGKEFYSSNKNYRDIPDITMQFGNVQYTREFWPINSIDEVVPSGKILTAHGLQECSEVTLADNEIAISFNLYERLFITGPQLSYVSPDLTEMIRMPEHIGQTFSFKLYHYESGKLLFDAGELKLVGIGFSPYDYIPRFTAGAKTINQINKALSEQEFIVKVASIDNLEKFLVDFRNEYNGYVSYVKREVDHNSPTQITHDYAEFIYAFEEAIILFKIIFLSIAIILSLILLLLAMNLISFSILNRKREIGILSALGATNKDIIKIFLIETLLIAAITFVFNLIAVSLVTVIVNKAITTEFILSIPLLRVDLVTIVTLIASSFGLLILAALIPLRKIIKLKPIDAIKNL